MAKTNKYDENSISVLEGLEAVRVRPGMYIGSVSTKGLNHLIYEIVDNAVDEHLAGYCTQIEVFLEKDGSATIKDNGRGVPVGVHKKGIPAARPAVACTVLVLLLLMLFQYIWTSKLVGKGTCIMIDMRRVFLL